MSESTRFLNALAQTGDVQLAQTVATQGFGAIEARTVALRGEFDKSAGDETAWHGVIRGEISAHESNARNYAGMDKNRGGQSGYGEMAQEERDQADAKQAFLALPAGSHLKTLITGENSTFDNAGKRTFKRAEGSTSVIQHAEMALYLPDLSPQGYVHLLDAYLKQKVKYMETSAEIQASIAAAQAVMDRYNESGVITVEGRKGALDTHKKGEKGGIAEYFAEKLAREIKGHQNQLEDRQYFDTAINNMGNVQRRFEQGDTAIGLRVLALEIAPEIKTMKRRLSSTPKEQRVAGSHFEENFKAQLAQIRSGNYVPAGQQPTEALTHG